MVGWKEEGRKRLMMNSTVGDGRGWPQNATRKKWVVFFGSGRERASADGVARVRGSILAAAPISPGLGWTFPG